MKAPPNTTRVATLTINGVGRMCPQGRKSIVEWLRNTAEHIEEEGHQYTHGRFRGSFNTFPPAKTRKAKPTGKPPAPKAPRRTFTRPVSGGIGL